MDLLTISENRVIPSTYTLVIPEFKAISVLELAYVYYMCDHRSPFSVYDEEKRSEEVIQSVFKKEYKVSSKLNAACNKYIDLTVADDNGKPIFHAKDLINNLEKMGKVVEGLTRLEQLVKKEEQVANQNRGGVVTNKYSQ